MDEYFKNTNNNLYFYDTYSKLTDDQKYELTDKYDIKFLSEEYIQKHADEFIIISPVHMPLKFRCDYTHHEFSGYLINKIRKDYDFKLIEVTGVKGKTTTTSLMYDMLDSVLLLNSKHLIFKSNGEEILLNDTLSITPASIITALNLAIEHDILSSVDFFICEVSLGITPEADIGVLTNIVEDYPIAQKSTSATKAKESVFKSKSVVCEYECFNKYYKDHSATLVSLNNTEANVYTTDINYGITESEIIAMINSHKIRFSCFALSDFYIKNILLALTVLDILGEDITPDLIKNTSPIKGRGSYYIKDKTLFIEDINPGLNTTSIKGCVDNLKRISDNFLIIIGGDYGITCEEINEDKLADFVKKLNNNQVILTGNVGLSVNKKLNNTYHYIDTLKNSLKSDKLENYNIIGIIYRTEYNKDEIG